MCIYNVLVPPNHFLPPVKKKINVTMFKAVENHSNISQVNCKRIKISLINGALIE